MSDPRPEYLTPAEVQQILRISRSAVYAAIRDGSLPHIRVGKLIRIPSAVLKVVGDE